MSRFLLPPPSREVVGLNPQGLFFEALACSPLCVQVAVHVARLWVLADFWVGAELVTDLLLLSCVQEFSQSSIFPQAYRKNQHANSKPNAPMMHQEPSLYSLFPWSPSLPASSGTSHLESFKLRRCPGSELSSDWQITPPQLANPLTRPTPAASHPHHPPTATELRPSLALAPSERRTAGTAG